MYHFSLFFKYLFIIFFSVSSNQSSELKNENIKGTQNLPPVPQRIWEIPNQKVGAIVRRIRPSIYKSSVIPYENGILYGKTVYLSPGHGWYWTGTGWTTQRGLSEGVVEDLSNAESVDQFLASCLMRAGANIIPVREIDTNSNMVIVDNDDTNTLQGEYIEEGEASLFSTSSLSGFSYILPISDQTNPFNTGTNRLLETSTSETARFVYVFNVPVSGYYNVYVSYSSWTQRAPDAHYIVYHPGGQTHFRVDQRHHGQTWVLLGRFWFAKGKNQNIGSVVLTNDSQYAGTDIQVSSDAVRIGGGTGIIARSGETSDYPRWEECCRYHAQFSGAPPTVYDTSSDDHNDDISCRSRLAAWIHETGEDSIYFSWHSNAGGGRGTSTYVYGPNPPNGSYDFTGVAGSDILANFIQNNVVSMFRRYYESDWRDRGVFSAYFGELNPNYNNEMPSALMEVLFHDSAEDMVYYKEPQVRYRAAREVCRSIIQYFAQKDGITPIYPPLAPTGLSVKNTGNGTIQLSWNPSPSDPVGGDPSGYRIYTGPLATAFNEGIITNTTSFTIENLSPSQTLYFKVSAINDAGESLSTPPVAVRISPSGQANTLIIDAFTKWDSDLSWMQDLGYSEPVHRINLKKMNYFRNSVGFHAPELTNTNAYFDMATVESFSQQPDFSNYEMIDLIVGRGTAYYPDELWTALSIFVSGGGKLFISGNRIPEQFLISGHSEMLGNLLGIESVSNADNQINVSFTSEGIFSEIGNIELSNGDDLTENYDTRFNDAFTTSSQIQSEYGNGDISGVLHNNIIYFGFPFEGIKNSSSRMAIMSEIVENFGINAPDAGTDSDNFDADDDTQDINDIDDTIDASNDTECNTDEMTCKTERVYGCHCSSTTSTTNIPILLPFLTFLGLIILRKTKSIKRKQNK